MSDYRRPPSYDCPPPPDHPAPQPKPPANGSTCEPITPTTPPELKPPPPCPPDPLCKCPKPPSTPECLEKLIVKHTADTANADKATQFKGQLDDLLKEAKAASQKYTRTKYDELVKRWVEQDVNISMLLSRLVCIVPCWRCVIECYVCPLLTQLRDAEILLYDNDKLYGDVNDLYDLQYWHTRDKGIKDRRVARIEAVLNVWTDEPGPAGTIENVLNETKELAGAISTAMGKEPAKALYDAFFKLIPRHLAIAPPATLVKTKIEEEFTQFCGCDLGEPDDCCGPDVGKLTFRQRLVGPLPYLVDPNEYYKLICCIVEQRFEPAKKAAWTAESALASVTARIATLTERLGPQWKTMFETDAKGAIPGEIDCCDYDEHDDHDDRRRSSYRS
jgi:hypothetical protein